MSDDDFLKLIGTGSATNTSGDIGDDSFLKLINSTPPVSKYAGYSREDWLTPPVRVTPPVSMGDFQRSEDTVPTPTTPAAQGMGDFRRAVEQDATNNAQPTPEQITPTMPQEYANGVKNDYALSADEQKRLSQLQNRQKTSLPMTQQERQELSHLQNQVKLAQQEETRIKGQAIVQGTDNTTDTSLKSSFQRAVDSIPPVKIIKDVAQAVPEGMDMAYHETFDDNATYNDILNKILYPGRVAMDTITSLPIVNRFLGSADEALGVPQKDGNGNPIEKMSTGNPILDFGTDFAGNVAGTTAIPGPSTGINSFNFVQDASKWAETNVAGTAAKYLPETILKSKAIPTIVAKGAGKYAMGAVDMAAFTLANDVAEGKSIKDTAIDTVLNAFIGGAFAMGLSGAIAAGKYGYKYLMGRVNFKMGTVDFTPDPNVFDYSKADDPQYMAGFEQRLRDNGYEPFGTQTGKQKDLWVRNTGVPDEHDIVWLNGKGKNFIKPLVDKAEQEAAAGGSGEPVIVVPESGEMKVKGQTPDSVVVETPDGGESTIRKVFLDEGDIKQPAQEATTQPTASEKEPSKANIPTEQTGPQIGDKLNLDGWGNVEVVDVKKGEIKVKAKNGNFTFTEEEINELRGKPAQNEQPQAQEQTQQKPEDIKYPNTGDKDFDAFAKDRIDNHAVEMALHKLDYKTLEEFEKAAEKDPELKEKFNKYVDEWKRFQTEEGSKHTMIELKAKYKEKTGKDVQQKPEEKPVVPEPLEQKQDSSKLTHKQAGKVADQLSHKLMTLIRDKYMYNKEVSDEAINQAIDKLNEINQHIFDNYDIKGYSSNKNMHTIANWDYDHLTEAQRLRLKSLSYFREKERALRNGTKFVEENYDDIKIPKDNTDKYLMLRLMAKKNNIELYIPDKPLSELTDNEVKVGLKKAVEENGQKISNLPKLYEENILLINDFYMEEAHRAGNKSKKRKEKPAAPKPEESKPPVPAPETKKDQEREEFKEYEEFKVGETYPYKIGKGNPKLSQVKITRIFRNPINDKITIHFTLNGEKQENWLDSFRSWVNIGKEAAAKEAEEKPKLDEPEKQIQDVMKLLEENMDLDHSVLVGKRAAGYRYLTPNSVLGNQLHWIFYHEGNLIGSSKSSSKEEVLRLGAEYLLGLKDMGELTTPDINAVPFKSIAKKAVKYEPKYKTEEKPAAQEHNFKEGDKVRFTDNNGKELTGTIKGFSDYSDINPRLGMMADVDVDQIMKAGGVPIGRREMVNIKNLRPYEQKTEEQPKQEVKAEQKPAVPTPPEQKPEEKPAEPKYKKVNIDKIKELVNRIPSHEVTIHFKEGKFKIYKNGEYYMAIPDKSIVGGLYTNFTKEQLIEKLARDKGAKPNERIFVPGVVNAENGAKYKKDENIDLGKNMGLYNVNYISNGNGGKSYQLFAISDRYLFPRGIDLNEEQIAYLQEHKDLTVDELNNYLGTKAVPIIDKELPVGKVYNVDDTFRTDRTTYKILGYDNENVQLEKSLAYGKTEEISQTVNYFEHWTRGKLYFEDKVPEETPEQKKQEAEEEARYTKLEEDAKKAIAMGDTSVLAIVKQKLQNELKNFNETNRKYLQNYIDRISLQLNEIKEGEEFGHDTNNGTKAPGTKSGKPAQSNGGSKNSQGDNSGKPGRSEVQHIQGTDDAVLQDGDATGSINENGNDGTDRTDADGISGAEENGVSEDAGTEGVGGTPKERKNLRLKVEDDWLASEDKNHSKYYLTEARKKMNQEVLNILDKDIKDITEEDKQILKNYSGKGGMGEKGREILTQYFTDYKTVDTIWKKIEAMGFNLDKVKALDPSTGAGVFMGFAPDGVKFDAIDIDPITAKVTSILYPDSKVMNKGFEEHRVNNAYDLVITNVPFSETRGEGIIKDKPHIKALHDYFMLAALDKAKDNGLIVMITPSSVMDGVDSRIRKQLTKDAEFITAYRLPSDVFAKTGTDVITDVIFLRRRVRDSLDMEVQFENNTMFEETDLIGLKDLDMSSYEKKGWKKDTQIAINSYYLATPDNILGEKKPITNRFGQPIVRVEGELDNKVIGQMLNDGVEYKPSPFKATSQRPQKPIIYYDPKEDDITPSGGVFEKDGKWYKRIQERLGDHIIDKGEEMSFTKEEVPTIREMLKVAALSQTVRVQARTGNEGLSKLISDLKASVDKFMAKNAAQFKNKKLIEKISTDPRYWVVKELSSNPDIFKTDTLTVKEYKITLDDAKNLEILAKHLLNRDGKITVENVAATYQGGISKGAARDILEHSDNFFKMPLEREVEEFDALGNVTYKRVKDTEYSYNRKIDYLSGNIYKKIEAVKAEIQKGHAEFEKNLKALEKVLPEPKTLKNTALTIKAKWMDTDIVEKFLHDYLGADFQITYNNIKREYVVKTIGGWAFTEKYKSLKINNGYLHTWLDTYLNDKDLIVYKGGEKDPIATATATKAMRKIDEYFLNYLKATPEVAEPLMHQYNYISNNWVQKDYSKDKIIIPGANPDFKFRNNQLEFVNMAMTLGSAVNAQRTGAGKTATNAAVNQMLKVTGRANKPIAVVPGKVIKKFVRDIKEGSRGLASIFPNMKILDTTDYTFNEALAKIAFNNWDLILMPDTWFKRISMTPERESLYVQEQLRLLEVSEQYRATIRGSKRSQTDYEKRKEQLLARLAELRNYSKQDGLYFEDLGIDAISMDEAQSVKNLVTSVKGADLGMSATPSQVALDFNMKAKYVMEKKNGKNIFLYTATPVSNSMLEIYGLLQNIAPQEWLDRHIFTPDDFVSSVVDNSPTIGITTSNEVGTIKKVDGFINIDDLRGLFRKYVDYRPFIEGAVIPDVEETRYTVDMTDWQRRFFKDILDRLKAIKDKKPRELPSGNLDNIMTVLHDARSASVSPSMVTGVLPTLENSPKVAMAIDVAAKIYKETGKNQVIFLGDDYGEKMLGKNNLHNFIKKELVKAGIPEKEIVIVNGQINSKPEKKLEIQDAFNDGKYKVIIGTSDTIGAGMDLQENTVSMINIDIPWTPTDVTQRRGRGERPGNVNKLIGNINFFTRGSYDAWSANIVGIKKKWQDQLLEGSGDSENGYLQNQDNDNYDIDTIMAELMEDPVEKEQHNLLAERRLITGEITSLNESLKSVEKQIADVEGGISERETKIKGYQEELIKKPDGKLAPMQIEKLSKTIESLTSELSELGDKKDGIVSGIKLKEDELQAFEQSVAGRLQAAEAKRGKPTAVSKEKNDTGALVKKLRETNKVLPKPKEVPSQFQGEEPKSHGGIYVGNRNRKVTGNEFENPTIEARYKSSHGIAREAWYTKIIDGIKEFYHMSTRTFRELPENTPEFAEAIKEILRMENHGKLAASETIRILKDIRKNLTPEDFDMFNRYVLVKDLAEDVSNGLDLPLGFTPADVQKELVKLDNKLTPEVKTALKKRSDYWGKIRRDYIAAMRDIGIDMSKRFTKDDYFRHQVLEYMNEKNSNAVEYSGTEARPDLSRGHLKERKGYEGDINTDYLQAEYQVMSQMFHDIRLAKSLKVFIDNYDISAKVHEEARKVAESTGAIVDWHDFIPEGYATFQLRQGRAFFQTMGLAQKAIDELLAAIPESIEINVDDVRKILAVGQRYKEYVMKQELVDKLGRMLEIKKENIISKLNRKALNAFKAWVTGINPEYFVKFNIRNFTGDLDRVIMADPKILKYLPKALNDVTAAYIKNKFSPELLPYWDKGGFENMQLPQELGDVNKMFPELFGKENLKNPVKFVLRGINGFSNWRESLLRYAAYLYYLEKYQKGEQVYYGPAKYNMIAGLKTNEDKAFEMQNYAVGAYNRVSETGKFISKYLIPFFRFMEHNFRAYVNAEINSVRPSIIKEQLNAKGKKVNAGNKIFQGSKNFTRQNVLALALTAIIFAWNQLRYPDEDEDLPDNAKEQPHVNLGYDKDGKPVYFTRVGTLGDFLEWFKDPLNKVASGFNPLYKTPAELVAGRSVFPDVRNPSTIRDKKLYGFKALGVEDVGRKILGLPENKTGTKGLPNLFIYKSDPEATAYQKTLDLKAQFETDTLGKSQTAAYNQSPKSNALYNYKLALKYEDGAAAEKFLQKYYDLGGTAKGLKTSLSSLDPLYGLSQDEQWQFYGSLTDKQFKDLQKAIDYYNDLLRR